MVVGSKGCCPDDFIPVVMSPVAFTSALRSALSSVRCGNVPGKVGPVDGVGRSETSWCAYGPSAGGVKPECASKYTDLPLAASVPLDILVVGGESET